MNGFRMDASDVEICSASHTLTAETTKIKKILTEPRKIDAPAKSIPEIPFEK